VGKVCSQADYETISSAWFSTGAAEQYAEQGSLSLNHNPVASYSDRLESAEHARNRLDMLARDGWRCRICGCSDRPLEAHHQHYGWVGTAREVDSLVSLCSAFEVAPEVITTRR